MSITSYNVSFTTLTVAKRGVEAVYMLIYLLRINTKLIIFVSSSLLLFLVYFRYPSPVWVVLPAVVRLASFAFSPLPLLFLLNVHHALYIHYYLVII